APHQILEKWPPAGFLAALCMRKLENKEDLDGNELVTYPDRSDGLHAAVRERQDFGPDDRPRQRYQELQNGLSRRRRCKDRVGSEIHRKPAIGTPKKPGEPIQLEAWVIRISWHRSDRAMSQEDIQATKAPLMEHLLELRRRLIWSMLAFVIAFGICFAFARPIYNLLLWPYRFSAGLNAPIELIYTAPQEFLFTEMKLALFGG